MKKQQQNIDMYQSKTDLNVKSYTVISGRYEVANAVLLETCFNLNLHFTHNSYQTFLTTSLKMRILLKLVRNSSSILFDYLK